MGSGETGWLMACAFIVAVCQWVQTCEMVLR